MTTYTAEQQAVNREKWVAALRSGEYQQAGGKLRTNWGGFCCLGVACELAAIEGVIPEWDGGYCGDNQVPPEAVVNWLGLTSECGATDEVERAWGSGGQVIRSLPLTVLNDETKWSFDRIADLVESGGVKVVGDPA
jgi:hypothetical protein